MPKSKSKPPYNQLLELQTQAHLQSGDECPNSLSCTVKPPVVVLIAPWEEVPVMASWCCMSPEVFQKEYANMKKEECMHTGDSSEGVHYHKCLHLPKASTSGQSVGGDNDRGLDDTSRVTLHGMYIYTNYNQEISHICKIYHARCHGIGV